MTLLWILCRFADEPVILRHTVVDYWAARDAWDTTYLAKHIGLKQVSQLVLLLLLCL
jgi:hypothetical protein